MVMAARSRCPIVFVVGRCSWKLVLRSWDRFDIPGPFARIQLIYGELPPPEDTREQIELARISLGEQMRRAGEGKAHPSVT